MITRRDIVRRVEDAQREFVRTDRIIRRYQHRIYIRASNKRTLGPTLAIGDKKLEDARLNYRLWLDVLDAVDWGGVDPTVAVLARGSE